MGCFNITGAISKMPIEYNDEIFLILTVKDTYSKDSYFAPGYKLTPISLPIFGKYNDYGTIKDISIDSNVKYIESIFDSDINSIIEAIDDYNVGRGSIDDNSLMQRIQDKVRGLCGSSLTEYFSNVINGLEVSFIMDHKFVFDSMVESHDMIPAYDRLNVEGSYESTSKLGWKTTFPNIFDKDYYEKERDFIEKCKELFPRNFYNNLTCFIRSSKGLMSTLFRSYFTSSENNWKELYFILYKDTPDFFERDSVKDLFINTVKFIDFLSFHYINIESHNYHGQDTSYKSLIKYVECMHDFINKRVNNEIKEEELEEYN